MQSPCPLFFFNSLVLLPGKKKLPCPLGWCSGSVGCYSWISPTPTRRHRHPLCMQAAEYSPIFSAQRCMARTWTLTYPYILLAGEAALSHPSTCTNTYSNNNTRVKRDGRDFGHTLNILPLQSATEGGRTQLHQWSLEHSLLWSLNSHH